MLFIVFIIYYLLLLFVCVFFLKTPRGPSPGQKPRVSHDCHEVSRLRMVSGETKQKYFHDSERLRERCSRIKPGWHKAQPRAEEGMRRVGGQPTECRKTAAGGDWPRGISRRPPRTPPAPTPTPARTTPLALALSPPRAGGPWATVWSSSSCRVALARDSRRSATILNQRWGTAWRGWRGGDLPQTQCPQSSKKSHSQIHKKIHIQKSTF